ncbi:MAG TPA: RNA methyltransferase, partial [Bacteroidales bacterium]|nr:RNA methyltransferase [Bacteroidales bacterium]
MLSRNQIKFIRSLREKKHRELHRCFTAEGSTLVTDLLQSSFPVKEVLASREWISENQSLLSDTGIPLTQVTPAEMERITTLTTPSPVLAVAGITEPALPERIGETELVLMLDDIRDPGNLGTLLRIADWFGIRFVICSENTVDLFNPKVIQASMGSIARVSVGYRNLQEYLEAAGSSIPVFGTFLEGNNI